MKTNTSSLITGAIAGGLGALTYAAYRKDITAAYARVGTRRQVIDTIEFAESGNGPAVLVVHGAGGGFDQGLALGEAFLGEHFRIIAPSRFGYLGTPLPQNASADAQADAHLRLLDALQLGRVPVIGVSAGGPSALQLCLKHPDRCSALVLIVPMAYAPATSDQRSAARMALINAIAASDFLFWSALKLARTALIKAILGTPIDVYQNATPFDRRRVDDLLDDILPISRRFAGIANDSVVASTLERLPLEEMRVPTLIISAADDGYRTYDSALYTAEHIRGAKFVGFATGGHLLLGHDVEVRSEVMLMMQEALEVEPALV